MTSLEAEQQSEILGSIADNGIQTVSTRSTVIRMEYNLLRKFMILNPSHGDSVGFISSIQGRTPFVKIPHYFVVTPLRTGIDLIQEEPAIVSADGDLMGRVKFGTAAVGEGEKFAVRILATKSQVSEGPLTKEPKEAWSSNSITVIRKK
jgi:hypothetical protein